MFDANNEYSTDHFFLNAVIDTLEEGVVVQNKEGKIVGFNQKALQLLAVSSDELIGNTSSDRQWVSIDINGEIIPTEQHPIVVTLRTEEPQKNVIMGVTTGDGKLKWFSTNTRMISVNQEKFAVAAFTDVTQLIELNKSLNEQNKLQQAIQKELEKKIDQLKDFAGIITHDVRGPASNIIKLIQMYERKKNEPSGQQTFEFLKQAGNDLLSNLNELIKLLQWHLDKNSPFSICNFNSITDSVLLQLNHLIQQTNATIHRDFDVLEFEYVQVYLHSIIYNLVSNALKYGRENEPLEITLKSTRKDGRICLSITDNGKGIDLKKFGSTLFHFQRNSELENDSKGIGLYLVQHQVEEFGGNITVNSEPNKGTTFTIVF